ncbi:uncharacterized protein LACBIDRAFT_329812 [Laccaria bicolor S238N-H82]|uniref:Predicted protein n=1 Tax=Laccaria bicolor (strain S238N-H82 / ATCC MYA-4686) TaxID=486041 RepID=B0DJB3_LACBS|nr:uncharacterized protein LACBIDRAFT_329812 [Laccaria bicolor S238N-H82]EDR05493.1 predicted protein [Laccaria bicolor S238N-H82]|eukprot:XP_001884051.1 predicted protein [Laccaria bicolor S238N-H82]
MSYAWAVVPVSMLLKQMPFLGSAQGTLASIVKTPSMAVPFAATLEALEKLPANPKNIVYIISGRDAFLERRLLYSISPSNSVMTSAWKTLSFQTTPWKRAVVTLVSSSKGWPGSR